MLVTFRSKASASVTMFGDVAVTLLKMMGHSGTVPGAILAKDIPDRLARLKGAIDSHKAREATESAHNANKDEEETGEHHVSLAHRALPLIEMLSATADQGCDVMWDEGL